jgi:hypothetical protein
MGIFSRRPKKVAILGCGPAGMFATHAFVEAGWDVTIYSNKRRSQMFGAQYLHRPIPGLPERKTSVEYRLEGTAAGYAEKVYPGGQVPTGQVSPVTLAGFHDAWDIRAAYFDAYERYEDMIINTYYERRDVPALLHMEFRQVVNTIPADRLCIDDQHQFLSQTIWAAGDAPEQGKFCPIYCPKDTVVCNGDPDRAWYRLSNVFGHTTCEWPEDRKPPLSGVASVVKPLRHNCDCWTGRIVGLGRYGAWKKGVLSHEAYEAAQALARR